MKTSITSTERWVVIYGARAFLNSQLYKVLGLKDKLDISNELKLNTLRGLISN